MKKSVAIMLVLLLTGLAACAMAGTPCGESALCYLDEATGVLEFYHWYDDIPGVISESHWDAGLVKKITIEEGIVRIGDAIFKDHTALEEVILPDSMSAIGNHAFENDNALTKIRIPTNVGFIGEGAFAGISCLTIVCDQGCYADTWAQAQGFAISYTGITVTPAPTPEPTPTPTPGPTAPPVVAALDEQTFPDAVFREWLRQYDTDGFSGLCQEELDAVTEMNLNDCDPISSLKGIEYFTALTELRVSSHQLTELEIRALTQLRTLNCSGNQITALDLSAAPNLATVDCTNNALTELKLGGNDSLHYMYCYGNRFTSLDVSGCRDLNQMAIDNDRQTGNGSYDTFQSPHYQSIIIYIHGVPHEEILDLSWYLQVDKTVTVLTTGGAIPPSVNPVTPTPEPTATPTAEPTATPTPEPTATPTVEPTPTPTPEPTAAPTVEPTAAPVTQVEYQGGVYTLAAKTATLTGTTKSTLTSLTIPASVSANGKTYSVTAIGKNACKGLKKLSTVTIGKNVKVIEKNAFASCVKLKTVKDGAGIKTIGDNAFSGCKALKTFPTLSKLTSLGAGAFKNCVKLAEFTIGTAVKSIGKNAFNGCSALKKITVKTKKLTEKNVGAAAFKGIHKKAVFKCPAKKLKAYKKLFIKRGAPETCTFE